MQFFEQQLAARRYTYVLLIYFCVAVALIIPLVYAVVLWAVSIGVSIHNFFGSWWDIRNRFEPMPPPALWEPRFFIGTAAVCILLMVGGAWRQLGRFARGGAALAALLGGDYVPPHTQDPVKRRLLNVVEEMAIASGLPMPSVYVLSRQAGINAFAAGLTPATSVIAITRGALDVLKRDELQAVIAHEFSHILHGDTRNKTILAGLLHGLMVPADTLIRLFSRGIKGGLPQLVLSIVIIVGFGIITIPLLVVLQVNIFLATLIKRLASRQREWLADAAAVQFTRNPLALAGALKGVGGYTARGRVLDACAREVSHLFFVDALGGADPARAGLLGCHPALVDRIRRVDPRFDGTFAHISSARPRPSAVDAEPPIVTDTPMAGGTAGFAVDRGAIPESVGMPDASHLAFATAMLAALPGPVAEAMHRTEGARAILYALLLSPRPDVRNAQLRHLRTEAAPEAVETMLALLPRLGTLPAGRRIPLVTIALHTLKQLTPAQFDACLRCLGALVAADNNVSLFEYGLERLILHRLAPAFGLTPPQSRQPLPRNAAGRQDACRMLLGCLAYWGTFDRLDQGQAYDVGMAALAPDQSDALPIPGIDACTVERFGQALDTLAAAPPAYRQHVLEACVACIAANGRTSPEEAECLQIIADALDLPLPPVLPQQGAA